MRHALIPLLMIPLTVGCGGEGKKKPVTDTAADEAAADEDASCRPFNLTLLEGETRAPSVVRLAVKVRCNGKPVTDKTEDDFTLFENGSEISTFESDLRIVPTVAAFRLANAMILDMSGSIVDSGYLDDLQVAARSFVDRLGDDQEVAIFLFDGRAALQPLIDFTNDHEAVGDAIASLDNYEVADPSTNLNGAILEGLSRLDALPTGASDSMLNASLVVFTDGTDMAGRVSNADAAAAVAATSHQVYAVGLGEEIDADHMSDIGTAGFFTANDVEALESAFEEVATAIRDEASSIYILAYCSPKRAGSHTLRVRLTGFAASTTFDFDATGFESGCDPTDFIPPEFLDADEDGYRPYDGDCDDNDASINPGTDEVCDDIDNDCNGQIDDGLDWTEFYPDDDGDGYGIETGALELCSEDAPAGYATMSGDCNETDPSINPGATELCDEIDRDCSGYPDDIPDTDTFTYYADNDEDGYGDDSTAIEMTSCLPPVGYVSMGGDCDDADPFSATVATDGDCDGIPAFADCDDTTAALGAMVDDEDCDGTLTPFDCDDGDADSTVIATDADCDGTITDEDCDDGDADSTIIATDADCDGFLTEEDCDDDRSDVFPGAAELVDGADQDCNGLIDDGTSVYDDDDDGYSEAEGDCDDDNPVIGPGIAEVCDGGIDNNCDGDADESDCDFECTPLTPAEGDSAQYARCEPPSGTSHTGFTREEAVAACIESGYDGLAPSGVTELVYEHSLPVPTIATTTPCSASGSCESAWSTIGHLGWFESPTCEPVFLGMMNPPTSCSYSSARRVPSTAVANTDCGTDVLTDALIDYLIPEGFGGEEGTPQPNVGCTGPLPEGPATISAYCATVY